MKSDKKALSKFCAHYRPSLQASDFEWLRRLERLGFTSNPIANDMAYTIHMFNTKNQLAIDPSDVPELTANIVRVYELKLKSQ